jgi:hypothetical protein
MESKDLYLIQYIFGTMDVISIVVMAFFFKVNGIRKALIAIMALSCLFSIGYTIINITGMFSGFEHKEELSEYLNDAVDKFAS